MNPHAVDFKDKILSLNIGEAYSVGTLEVTRIPGGFLYERYQNILAFNSESTGNIYDYRLVTSTYVPEAHVCIPDIEDP